jgi:excisionase family DNA binding protein
MSAGWTGLEPAASGVTGGRPGIAGVSTSMQVPEKVQSANAPETRNSQTFARSPDGLLTTFLQALMTVAEVARHLGVSRSTVYQLCERGELHHLRVSNAIRVPIAAVASYVQRRAPGPGR